MKHISLHESTLSAKRAKYLEKQSEEKECLKASLQKPAPVMFNRALGCEDAKATDRLVKKSRQTQAGLQVLPQTAEAVLNSADSDWCMKLRDCAFVKCVSDSD